MDEAAVYSAIGEEGFARLVRGFYKQVPDDPLLGPMYPGDDLAGAEQRLRDFLKGLHRKRAQQRAKTGRFHCIYPWFVHRVFGSVVYT